MKKNLFFCQKGVLTLQFLFGFIIVSGFMVVFALLTLTLVAGEVTQYITFSASRSLFLSHISKEEQRKKAAEKYRTLSSEKFKFFSAADGNAQNKWFDIKEEISGGEGLGLNRDFTVTSSQPNLFYGVWTHFQAKVLVMDMLFLGETTEDSGDKAFRVESIGSYLGREPSQEECDNFTEKRWDEILSKHKEESVPSIVPNSPDNYRNYTNYDNGC